MLRDRIEKIEQCERRKCKQAESMFEKNQVVLFGYSTGQSKEVGNKMQTSDS